MPRVPLSAHVRHPGNIIVTTQALYMDRAIRGYDTVKTTQRLGAGVYLKKPYMIDSLGKAVKNALAGTKMPIKTSSPGSSTPWDPSGP